MASLSAILACKRQQLADLHAGHVGLDRLEFATIFDRGVRLEVVHVHVTGAAVQVDHDDGLVRRLPRASPLCPKAKHVRQAQAANAEGADLEEIPAGYAITKPLVGAEDIQHELVPSGRRLLHNQPRARARVNVNPRSRSGLVSSAFHRENSFDPRYVSLSVLDGYGQVGAAGYGAACSRLAQKHRRRGL